MQLKHIKMIMRAQNGEARIRGVAWAPNNKKMAVCTSDRVIILYDENGDERDKFATKPADASSGKKSYIVKSIAFSPDSTKLAVAQTDNIIFVYKLGEKWNEKKTICNKFVQQSPVTAMIWPIDQPIVLGLADGKVRAANVKSNKSSTIYNADSYVVSLASNVSGKGFVSSHADGTIVRYYFDDEGSGDTQGKFATHSCPAYALAWAGSTVIAAGCDKRIYAYSRDGRVLQQFDFSRDDDEKEFTVAVCNPSGQSVVVGSFNRLRLFNWSQRKGLWEEGKCKDLPNRYTITALGWKNDGSKVSCGTLCGGIDLFDCTLKRVLYKDKFEINYVGPSQVIVRNVKTDSRYVIKSFYGSEIDEVKIMGGDRFFVAHTSDTLMLGDLIENKLSEVAWQATGGHEKYYFENENVCIIFNAGELTMVEYGSNEILGCVRTEFMNPHLISVRINERKQRNVEHNKKIAYLIDLKTIAILDLVTGFSLGQVTNDFKIDWLELNETAKKLLFRDKKLRLHLYDIESLKKTTILNYCTYVQWVQGSDVIVAQSRDNLCIWYNIEAPERVTMFPLKGDIVDIERNDGKTDVLVNEGVTTMSYTLDEGLIEFGTAMDDGDFGRAVVFLETLEMTPETEAMWRSLAKMSLEAGQLRIAERCYAALGDVCKARYLIETNKLAEEMEAAGASGDSGLNFYKVRARMAVLDKNFKGAENIYLEQNQIDEAIEMYQQIHKWDDALEIAEVKGHPELETLRREFQRWLIDTNQEEKAGEVKERDGDYLGAINMYMKSKMSARAARLALNRPDLRSNTELLNKIAQSLVQSELFEKAGEVYEAMKNSQEAMKCYRKGKSFQRAVELARNAFPADVVRLEEEWGDHLVTLRQLDNAIHHFIEAGSYHKAVDAAINSRQWTKAEHILSNMDMSDKVQKSYRLLAIHYASIREYQKAEQYYIKADCVRDAVNMYNAAGLWEEAHRLASHSMDRDELSNMYLRQANELESSGKFKEAERLYVTVNEVDKAIGMYKRHKLYKDVLRLVKQRHPDLLEKTYYHLAQELEQEGNLRQAEQYYVEVGDWKAAVNMYRNQDSWEEAYRVANNSGDSEAPKQVAYLWAKHLGGDSAVKLLTKFGLLEKAIDYATDHCAFEFAFDLARTAMAPKMTEIHNKYAMYLEDEGKFADAEAEFIKANKPREAVLMYVHNQDWDSAQRVAEQHDPDSVADVLVGQARFAFEEKDYTKAESYLLRAQRPDMAVKSYRDAGMWQDALRVCQEYLPHKLAALQEEYEREMTTKQGKSTSSSLLEQGSQWESSGEYLRAVECYVKLTPEVTPDTKVLEKAWIKAVDLAVKFLGHDKAQKVVSLVGPKLMEIKRYNLAAEVYLNADQVKEAVDAYIAAEEWNKAKKVAQELEPRLEQYVESKYKQSLKSAGKADQLAGVDILSALDMYAQQGKWTKCLAMAEQQNSKVLHKYLALYAAQLIKDEKADEAAGLYVKYGTPANSQNVNIYKRIFQDLTTLRSAMKGSSYPIYSQLRDMLSDLCNNAANSKELSKDQMEEFERMLWVSHFYAIRCAALSTNDQNLQTLVTKITISLLRYTDLIPVDKAFYDAGMACKKLDWENMAFVFLNRYLDLLEAIEDPDGSADMLDNSDFQDTDIPLEVPLPSKPSTTSEEHEEIREWILAVSMDQKLEQVLPKDMRGVYEASLYASTTGTTAFPCLITGYPVIGDSVPFKKSGCLAIKDEWSRFVMAAKLSKSQECRDAITFISNWCGTLPNQNYSFN